MRLLTYLLVFSMLVFCGHNPPSASGATPEEAARRVIPKLSRHAPTTVELHGSQVTPHGTVVLFTIKHDYADMPQALPYMGYVLTRQRGDQWRTLDVAQTTIGSRIPTYSYVDFSSQRFDLNNAPMDMFYGLALKPEVAAVEVTYNTGDVERTDVTAEGMFALVAEGSVAVCALRVLDAQDQVLEAIQRDGPANYCS
jgi:hypothetical protein